MAHKKVTLAQIPCQLHDKEANLRRMHSVVEGTTGDIVIFPELNITGYMPRDDLFKLAEPMNGRSITRVVEMAKEAEKDIVFGMAVEDEEVPGHLFNSALVATGNGDLYRYDKMYLPNFGPFEERVFFVGGRAAAVVPGMHAKIGLNVCYDIFFPELAKLESMMGAQILVNLSASPTTSRHSFDMVLPARAVENGVFMVFVNMVGVHGSLVFSGGSRILSPRGEVIAQAYDLKEQVVEAEIDLDEVPLARRFRPLARDVRPEVLEALESMLRVRPVSDDS